MLQIIGLLAISWLLLWLVEKKHLNALGIEPSMTRMRRFVVFFGVSAGFSALAFGLRMYFAQESYILAQPLNAPSVLLEIWYQFRSVLTEELLCRGALLYILIKKIGAKNATLVSSILFAGLHGLQGGVWGDMIQMVLVFGFTFLMGCLLAYAFVKTSTLWLPLAIHFGWNLVQNYIFPDNAAGNHLFVLAGPPPVVTISYVAFFTMLLLPKFGVLLVNYLLLKRLPQAQMA